MRLNWRFLKVMFIPFKGVIIITIYSFNGMLCRYYLYYGGGEGKMVLPEVWTVYLFKLGGSG
jgi:hypothetical protein